MAQVTLKDVARVAGVHFTTVSLALRDSPSIPTTTKERIRKVAERMGYVVNPIYAALTRRRQKTAGKREPPKLAYLVNRPPELGFDLLPHHGHILAGARQQAKALGYALEQCFVDDLHYNSERLAAHFREQRINGFIIAAFEPGLSRLVLDWSRYAMVKIDSLHMEPAVSLVTSDQERIVRMCFRRLRDLGYHRIGMAVGRADDDCTDRRFSSGLLIEQVRIAEKERVPPLFFPYNAKAAEVVPLLERWCRMHSVDAVFGTWTNIDCMLQKAGFAVPEQIACACMCLGEAGSRLAGVYANLEVVGAQAVSVLALQLRGGETGISRFPTATLIPGEWQDGETAPTCLISTDVRDEA